MKKKILSILLLSVLIGSAFVFTACAPKEYGVFFTVQEAYENGYLTKDDLKNISYYSNEEVRTSEETIAKNVAGLSEEKAEKIKSRYAALLRTEYGIENAEASGITIKKCFGIYQGKYVAVIFSGYLESIRADRTEIISESIADYRVQYAYSDEKVYIWKPSEDDGALYTLKQAYDENLYPNVGLDIYSIAKKQNVSAQLTDFTPKELEPKELDKETEKKIKESMAYKLQSQDISRKEKIKASDVTVADYYGVYNGCVVVGLRAKSLYFIDNEYKIDGVAFDDATLKVWKEK